ncbi:acyl-CoA thioesterase [Nocardioides montaniterrae]
MRHRFSCPLRWADLDLLGHVNNVRYLDYLRAARDDVLHAAALDLGPAGLAVGRHELTFLAPLHYGPEPVVVDVWLSSLEDASAVLEYAVHDGSPQPVTFLRARSFVSGAGLAALAAYVEPGEEPTRPTPPSAQADPERSFALHLRAGDLDVTGHASDVSCVEYFQEARIDFLRRLLGELPDTSVGLRWVVAQTDLDYLAPIAPSRTPYGVASRLAKVGNKSLVIESVLRDTDGTAYAAARVVLVVFDPVTQRSAEPPAGYREVLEALVEAG